MINISYKDYSEKNLKDLFKKNNDKVKKLIGSDNDFLTENGYKSLRYFNNNLQYLETSETESVWKNILNNATETNDGLLSKEDRTNIINLLKDTHNHTNKNILDSITQENLDDWNKVSNKAESVHKHSLEDITNLSDLDETYAKKTDLESKSDTNHKHTVSEITDIATIYATKEDVSNTVASEVAKVIGNADEDFDTLKEIEDWIKNHQSDALSMNSAINTNTTDITSLKGKSHEHENMEVLNNVTQDILDFYTNYSSHVSDKTIHVTPEERTSWTNKVDKEEGKGLSTNDFTTTLLNKLNGISENANNYSLPKATDTVLGGIKVGSNLTNTDGLVSLSKDNVVAALGYTPANNSSLSEYLKLTGGTLNDASIVINDTDDDASVTIDGSGVYVNSPDDLYSAIIVKNKNNTKNQSVIYPSSIRSPELIENGDSLESKYLKISNYDKCELESDMGFTIDSDRIEIVNTMKTPFFYNLGNIRMNNYKILCHVEINKTETSLSFHLSKDNLKIVPYSSQTLSTFKSANLNLFLNINFLTHGFNSASKFTWDINWNKNDGEITISTIDKVNYSGDLYFVIDCYAQ